MLSQVQQLIATKAGWEPVEELQRLEGFKEVWERTLFRGRELKPDQTLESVKLPAGATIAAVRKVLVAEGWKARTPSNHLHVNCCTIAQFLEARRQALDLLSATAHVCMLLCPLTGGQEH